MNRHIVQYLNIWRLSITPNVFIATVITYLRLILKSCTRGHREAEILASEQFKFLFSLVRNLDRAPIILGDTYALQFPDVSCCGIITIYRWNVADVDVRVILSALYKAEHVVRKRDINPDDNKDEFNVCAYITSIVEKDIFFSTPLSSFTNRIHPYSSFVFLISLSFI